MPVLVISATDSMPGKTNDIRESGRPRAVIGSPCGVGDGAPLSPHSPGPPQANSTFLPSDSLSISSQIGRLARSGSPGFDGLDSSIISAKLAVSQYVGSSILEGDSFCGPALPPEGVPSRQVPGTTNVDSRGRWVLRAVLSWPWVALHQSRDVAWTDKAY